MKVLLSAYACEPEKGSEPYVGWTWARAVARVADQVHVITRGNNRAPIEKGLAESPVPNLHFHYFDLPAWSRFWKRGQRGVHLYYYLWQHAVPRFASRLHEEHSFDVVHHVSMAGQHYPPGVAALPAPFIWGPIGGLRIPPVLRRRLHARARVEEATHDALIQMARRDALVRRAFRGARLVLSFPGRDELHEPQGKVITTGNIFIDTDAVPLSPKRKPDGGWLKPLHLVGAFRMIFWKGGDLGIEAIARLKSRGVRVSWTLVGEGPERRRWESLARRLRVADQIHFPGWLPRVHAMNLLAEGDVLLHPAYREGWGGAVLEGMGLGLPVVCLDHGGPGYLVDSESGIAVPSHGSREAIVEGLATAIDRMRDPESRRRMGEAARERVRERFSLAALDRTVAEVYAQAL